MANVSSIKGMEYVRQLGSGTAIVMPAWSTGGSVLGVGDPVAYTTRDSTGRITVVRSTAGGLIHGIVVNPRVSGWQYTDTDRRTPAVAGSPLEIMVVNPFVHVFRMQNASAATFIAGASSVYCDLDTIVNANAYTGLSGQQVNLGTNGSTTVGQVYVLGLDYSLGAENVSGLYEKLLLQVSNT